GQRACVRSPSRFRVKWAYQHPAFLFIGTAGTAAHLYIFHQEGASSMSDFVENVYRERVDFAKIKSNFPIPDLLEVQKLSYQRFLQADVPASERDDSGLQGVFESVFPITDFRGTSSLEFVDYEIGDAKYTIEECKERGMTYAAPLKVTIRLVVWDKDPDTEEKTIRDIKEQEVYFGDIPIMTENGLFIINGTERVI